VRKGDSISIRWIAFPMRKNYSLFKPYLTQALEIFGHKSAS